MARFGIQQIFYCNATQINIEILSSAGDVPDRQRCSDIKKKSQMQIEINNWRSWQKWGSLRVHIEQFWLFWVWEVELLSKQAENLKRFENVQKTWNTLHTIRNLNEASETSLEQWQNSSTAP